MTARQLSTRHLPSRQPPTDISMCFPATQPALCSTRKRVVNTHQQHPSQTFTAGQAASTPHTGQRKAPALVTTFVHIQRYTRKEIDPMHTRATPATHETAASHSDTHPAACGAGQPLGTCRTQHTLCTQYAGPHLNTCAMIWHVPNPINNRIHTSTNSLCHSPYTQAVHAAGRSVCVMCALVLHIDQSAAATTCLRSSTHTVTCAVNYDPPAEVRAVKPASQATNGHGTQV